MSIIQVIRGGLEIVDITNIVQDIRCSLAKFEERSRSAALPGIDLDEIARIVIATDDSEQAEAVRAYRRSLRGR